MTGEKENRVNRDGKWQIRKLKDLTYAQENIKSENQLIYFFSKKNLLNQNFVGSKTEPQWTYLSLQTGLRSNGGSVPEKLWVSDREW